MLCMNQKVGLRGPGLDIFALGSFRRSYKINLGPLEPVHASAEADLVSYHRLIEPDLVKLKMKLQLKWGYYSGPRDCTSTVPSRLCRR